MSAFNSASTARTTVPRAVLDLSLAAHRDADLETHALRERKAFELLTRSGDAHMLRACVAHRDIEFLININRGDRGRHRNFNAKDIGLDQQHTRLHGGHAAEFDLRQCICARIGEAAAQIMRALRPLPHALQLWATRCSFGPRAAWMQPSYSPRAGLVLVS